MSATMVTGGLGYCGRHVVDQLRTRGENVVSYNRDYAEAAADGVTLVQGELYDIPRLLQTIREHSVERIVHTAAMSHPDLSIEFPIATFQANVDGTVNLFEAARLAGVHRIVYFSSETVYGHIDGTVREEAPLHPTTPYGVTKVTGELLADVYTRLYEFDAIFASPLRGVRTGEQDAHGAAGHAPRRRPRSTLPDARWRRPPLPVHPRG
jgi:UDP-glucose 4-epimerase